MIIIVVIIIVIVTIVIIIVGILSSQSLSSSLSLCIHDSFVFTVFVFDHCVPVYVEMLCFPCAGRI